MSDTYTKLFRSIAASTIVSEPLATRWLWVTMLSQADKAGKVYASVPGLARMANISLEECEQGLACFLSTDQYSRTADHEGRRIEPFDGGWRLLNHAKYDAMRSEAERSEYKRKWDRENRSKAAKAEADAVRQSDTFPTDSDKPDASDPISHSSYLNSQQEQKPKAVRASAIPCPDGVTPQVWADWLQLRKAKKAPVTKTALEKASDEAAKADMTLDVFLRVWCARGSQGLEASWLKPHERAGPRGSPEKHSGFEQRDYGQGGAM